VREGIHVSLEERVKKLEQRAGLAPSGPQPRDIVFSFLTKPVYGVYGGEQLEARSATVDGRTYERAPGETGSDFEKRLAKISRANGKPKLTFLYPD
jgi:hypothetical protein